LIHRINSLNNILKLHLFNERLDTAIDKFRVKINKLKQPKLKQPVWYIRVKRNCPNSITNN